jgi:hypothetical protein
MVLTRLAILAALATVAAAEDAALVLRGYGEVRWTAPAAAAAPAATVHRFALSSPERAARFASKILADYELTVGNRIRPGPGGCTLVELAGGGLIAPLASAGSAAVTVVVAPDERALAAALPSGAWLGRAALRHPDWMDKWDRHCLGMWQYIKDYAADPVRPTLDGFYRWFGEQNLLVQINRGGTAVDLAVNGNQTDYLRTFFAHHGVRYQQVEWLANQHDLYNRNPFLAAVPNPAVATRSSYYGERFFAGNPLRALQNRNAWQWLQPTLGDELQQSLLDPDGELGPFDFDRWGAHGPMAQREFVRFLREVRGLDLDAVSRRYTGRAGSFRSWEEVPLVDWRTFYGFTASATDLAGEWRFRRDDAKEGLVQGWAEPGWDDGDWIRLHYPGDPLVFGLPKAGGPLWMRRSVAMPAPAAGGRTLLSVALLTSKPAQVFVNGVLAGTIAPRVHTALCAGQVDVTGAAAPGQRLTVALRLATGDAPIGPVFLTGRALEDFPTSDALLNARRFDHQEFVDWAMAQAMGTTLATLRSLDPDRPIKVHAFDSSPWGWSVLARYGGYSHHTGSGAGWHWSEPKQYGAARGLQDSSEPGGPMNNLRELRGLFANLVSMGKNAHDYFINLQSITRDPAMRSWFEARMPDLRVMGRANVTVGTVAAIRGHLNSRYTGEFARWETWRYGIQAERGGELMPLLDEVRIREGRLDAFKAIIDEGTAGWDAAMSTALRTYVEAGGTLLLNAQSGRHDFVDRDARPAAALAGCALGEPLAAKTANLMTFADPGLAGLPASAKAFERTGEVLRQLVPGAGAVVAATWPDGSPALVRRTLGKGQVWLCGAGTYPRELIAVLATLHGPAVWATATGADLVRTCRSNNGCEDLLMVRGAGGKPVTVTWRFDARPAGIYDPVSGRAVEAAIDGTTATFTIPLADWDFAWFAARRGDPDAQFRHWFRRQGEMWSGTAPGAEPPAAPPFRHLDLNRGWTMARTATWDEAVALAADGHAALKPAPLILWDAPGTPAGGPCALYRSEFTLPAGWERDALHLSLRGQVHDSRLHGFDGRHAILLNGTEIWKGGRTDSLRLDIGRLVKPGRNRLEFIHQGPGLMLGLMVVRSPLPNAVTDLAGPWRSVEGPGREVERALPGEFKTAFVYRDLVVPTDKRDQEVWLQVDGSYTCAIINGRLRYWDAGNGSTTAAEPGLALDITPDIRWGASNRIVLASKATMEGWQVTSQACRSAQLGFYAAGRWSGSGTPNRAVLTAAEQAALARDLGTVQAYALVPPATVQRSDGEERPDPAFTAPVPGLDLVFGGDAPVADQAPGALPLKLRGDATVASEAGGRIRALFLHADATRRSSIEIPRERLRPLFAGGRTTLHAWIKPIANDGAGGALFNWGSWYTGWGIDDDACSASVPQGRLDAEAVVRQRRWQALTLVNDGTAATLYVDGRPAAAATWPAAITGIDAPGFIASDGHVRGFLNARLGAFRIYPQALPAATVRQLVLREREAFRTAPGAPEDDRFRLAIGADGPGDASDIPATLAVGPGVTVAEEGGRRHLALDGKRSWLLPQDHARSKLFCAPFTLVAELRLAPGAGGVILRRHHMLCLFTERNGDLVLDANIGRRDQACRFPAALAGDGWHRIALAYDGRRVGLTVDDRPAVVRDYEASVFPTNSDYPVGFFADNTRGPDNQAPGIGNLACQLRELRVIDGALFPAP